MNPDRWRQIEVFFHAALEMPAGERSAYLDSVCGEDAELRGEIDELLASAGASNDHVQSLIGRTAAFFTADPPTVDLAGKTIGPFQILHRIGAGGMGTVYLAIDNRLGRRVALKVLPESFRRDSERLRRFEQEARAASALNHPNILTIHNVEKTDDLCMIVTEFVEGETLADWVSRGKHSIDEIAGIAAQVADALSEAHRTGIVHRDVKPGNIMITPRGVVKVLDFGLAKMIETNMLAAGPNERTATGIILGTVQYMSPEQAAGKDVDHRSDIFSVGIVMYQMITSHLPFDAETTVETLQQIIKSDPEPVDRFRDDVPWELDRIVRKCMEKNADWRYQSASEIAIDLRNLKRSLESGGTVRLSSGPATVRRPRRWPAVALISVAVVVIAGILAWKSRDPQPVASSTAPPSVLQLTTESGVENFPSISPDGQTVVYSARGDIFLQRVGGRNAINLTSDTPEKDMEPSFSPDGQRIVFHSQRDKGGIFVMGATGESVKRVSNNGYNPAWSPDGKTIVVSTENVENPNARSHASSQLWLVDVETGAKTHLQVEDGVQPTFSPDGRRVAYWALRGGQRDIWTISVKGGDAVQLTNDEFMDWNPVWSPDGRFVYFASDRGGTMNLWRTRIDTSTGKGQGKPEPVAIPSNYVKHVTFSRDGRRLAYVNENYSINVQAFAFDPELEKAGAPYWITEGSHEADVPSVSPDGEWVAFSDNPGRHEDVFVIRKDGTGLRQLTHDAFRDRRLEWSPDGQRLWFYSDRSGVYGIWSIKPDGSELQQVTSSNQNLVYPKWAPDGKRMSFCLMGGHTMVMDSGVPASAQLLPPMSDPTTWFIGWNWSPDSRRLAGWLGIDQRSHGGISVYSFDTKTYDRVADGGRYPVWLKDGRRLIYCMSSTLELCDTKTRTSRTILSIAPATLSGCDLSPDNRTIYCANVKSEADIWVMEQN